MADKTLKEVQEALAAAEDRANRATKRARDAEEHYRRLQLDLVKAKDEASAAQARGKALEERVAKLEGDLATMRTAPMAAKGMAPPARKTEQMPVQVPIREKVEGMLKRVESLRELLATASIELSQLNADEVALAKKRTRVLSDACTLLARALGESGEAPPPLPPAAESKTLGARLSLTPASSVDISEVAELVESLRPPRI